MNFQILWNVVVYNEHKIELQKMELISNFKENILCIDSN